MYLWRCIGQTPCSLVHVSCFANIFGLQSSSVIYIVSRLLSLCLFHCSHLDGKSADQAFAKDGYFCPQCFSKYCDLPVDCVTCGGWHLFLPSDLLFKG